MLLLMCSHWNQWNQFNLSTLVWAICYTTRWHQCMLSTSTSFHLESQCSNHWLIAYNAQMAAKTLPYDLQSYFMWSTKVMVWPLYWCSSCWYWCIHWVGACQQVCASCDSRSQIHQYLESCKANIQIVVWTHGGQMKSSSIWSLRVTPGQVSKRRLEVNAYNIAHHYYSCWEGPTPRWSMKYVIDCVQPPAWLYGKLLVCSRLW